MIIYLVRHGETAYNRDGLGLGRADVPLTELGQRQALAVAARLAEVPLDRVFSSPLERALSVARAIAGERGVPLDVRAELTEMDVGETEGLTFPEMRERHAPFLAEWRGPGGAAAVMPGGESLSAVDVRLQPFYSALRGTAADAVAVVSHNFVLRLLLCHLLGLELGAFRSFLLGLASVSMLSLERGEATLRLLNDSCHLDGLNLPPAARSL
ncbi:MAG: histidine phosphatase family protein [Tepidiformaceae bacterium]